MRSFKLFSLTLILIASLGCAASRSPSGDINWVIGRGTVTDCKRVYRETKVYEGDKLIKVTGKYVENPTECKVLKGGRLSRIFVELIAVFFKIAFLII